jgi:separase
VYSYQGVPVVHDEIDLEILSEDIIDAIKAFYIEYRRCKESRLKKQKHLVLILDKNCQHIPWESLPVMRGHSVSRMPSYLLLQERMKMSTELHVNSCYYILNPSGDLSRTEKIFRHFFADSYNFLTFRAVFSGHVGSEPSSEEFATSLGDKDLFLYFGHGGTEKYITGSELISISKTRRIPTSLLFGCSSGYMKPCGRFDPRGIALEYLLAGRFA